jgi:hypothetical protein
METTDFSVLNQSSIFLLTPNSESAKEWVDENIDSEAMWWGNSVVVEHRYIRDIVDGLLNDGFTVE